MSGVCSRAPAQAAHLCPARCLACCRVLTTVHASLCTADAYDGKRLCKWNGPSSPYGQAWTSGDVIGCCIDLDAREISFYRNGVSLGVAFTNVRTMQVRVCTVSCSCS